MCEGATSTWWRVPTTGDLRPAESHALAVVRLGNTRGVATARRLGMEWVGETDKCYGLTLQIYRLTAADLDYPEPTAGVRRY